MGEPKQFTTTTPYTKHIVMSGLDLDTNNTRKHQTTNWWSLHHQTTMPTNHLIMDLVFNKVCVFAFRACNYHFLCVSRLHLIYRPLNIFVPLLLFVEGVRSKKMVLPYNTMWTNRKKIVKKNCL